MIILKVLLKYILINQLINNILIEINLIINYWAQLFVILGIIGSILDYRIKNKELKFKYLYKIKLKKII